MLLCLYECLPALPCNNALCQLPKCRCAGTDIPGGLAAKDTPQIVVMSFDDAFLLADYQTYYQPIFSGRKNPNGCPVGLTLFTSHNFTDYSALEQAHLGDGFEVADHTVDHNTHADTSSEEWGKEITQQRQMLNKWANIQQVTGFRAPFLETSETMLSVLAQNNFTYDASMADNTHYWPFTYDYKSPICYAPFTCPVNSYPGLWEIPAVNLIQANGVDCDMVDQCQDTHSLEEFTTLLTSNFFSHYNTTRSPLGLYMHSGWLRTTGRDVLLKKFLGFLATFHDVYVVTHAQLLSWVQSPTTLAKIADFAPWRCDHLHPLPRCNFTAPSCAKYYEDDQRLLHSCTAPCPPHMPKLDDVDGN